LTRLASVALLALAVAVLAVALALLTLLTLTAVALLGIPLARAVASECCAGREAQRKSACAREG